MFSHNGGQGKVCFEMGKLFPNSHFIISGKAFRTGSVNIESKFFLVILMRDFSVLSADDTATKQVYEGGRGMCERVREVVYRSDAV